MKISEVAPDQVPMRRRGVGAGVIRNPVLAEAVERVRTGATIKLEFDSQREAYKQCQNVRTPKSLARRLGRESAWSGVRVQQRGNCVYLSREDSGVE